MVICACMWLHPNLTMLYRGAATPTQVSLSRSKSCCFNLRLSARLSSGALSGNLSPLNTQSNLPYQHPATWTPSSQIHIHTHNYSALQQITKVGTYCMKEQRVWWYYVGSCFQMLSETGAITIHVGKARKTGGQVCLSATQRQTLGCCCLLEGGMVRGRHLERTHFHLNYKITCRRDWSAALRACVCVPESVCVCERERERERTRLSDGMIKCVSQQVGVREKAQNGAQMSERDKESPSVRCMRKGPDQHNPAVQKKKKIHQVLNMS